MIRALLPVAVLSPFVQRHFKKGMLIGAIKAETYPHRPASTSRLCPHTQRRQPVAALSDAPQGRLRIVNLAGADSVI